MIVYHYNDDQWLKRDLAHGMVTELSIKGEHLRTPEEHARLLKCEPTEEEVALSNAMLNNYEGRAYQP